MMLGTSEWTAGYAAQSASLARVEAIP